MKKNNGKTKFKTKITNGILVIFFLLALIIIFNPGKADINSQDNNLLYEKFYGGAEQDKFFDIIEVSTGGFAIVGYTWSFGEGYADVWIVRTDTDGNELWSHTYGGLSGDNAQSVIECSDGGFAIIGATGSFGMGSYDVWLLRTDADGEILWTRTYGGSNLDHGYDLIEMEDGGFMLLGTTRSYGAGYDDIWLIRTDFSGNSIWHHTYGGPSREACSTIVKCDNGTFVISGTTFSFGNGNADVWLIKVDSFGNHIWDITYGGSEDEFAHDVVACFSGGFAISGYTYSYGAGAADLWLIRTDDEGQYLWDETYGYSPVGTDINTGYDVGTEIVEKNNGGFVITGYSGSFTEGVFDMWLIQTREDGYLISSDHYGGPKFDYGYAITKCSTGGYAIAGIYGVDNNYDGWLVKIYSRPLIPIIITHDDDFLVYNFPGAGTAENPYIIENYDYYYDGAFAISITGTTKHFIVRNNYFASRYCSIIIENIAPGTAKLLNNRFSVLESYTHGYGIYLNNTGPVEISNNECSIYSDYDSYGIYSNNADNSSVVNNEIFCRSDTSNNWISYGFYSEHSDFLNITNNSFNSSCLNGRGVMNIHLFHSKSPNIINNTCIGSSWNCKIAFGIILKFSALATLENNMCDIESYNSQGTTAAIYGQNSPDCIIKNNTCEVYGEDTTVGVYTVFSNNSIVVNNYIKSWTITGYPFAIVVFKSKSTKIMNNFCVIPNSKRFTSGIYVEGSISSTIQRNFCSVYGSEYTVGIFIINSKYIKSIRNNCSIRGIIAGIGIELVNSNSTTLSRNFCETKGFYEDIQSVGVKLTRSSDCSLDRNFVRNNKIGILILEESNRNTLTRNTLRNNLEYGIKILDNCDKNLIFNNYFYNNNPGGTSQAYDSNDNSNRWYYARIKRGNYWSDLRGRRRYPIDGNYEVYDHFPMRFIFPFPLP